MIDGFTEAQIIGTVVAFLVTSYVAFFGWLVTSLHGLRREMHDLNRDTRRELGARIDALDQKLNLKIDALTVALSRVEGAVYHGCPSPRRALSE